MVNNQRRKRIYLAALLHDIGKFWQRADKGLKDSQCIRELYTEDSYQMTVPVYENGTPKYRHALWTNAFFERTRIGSKLKLNLENDLSLGNLSANHHQPSTHDEMIISIADRWSSGIDRPDSGEENVELYPSIKEKYGKDFIAKVGLHSIFDELKISEQEKPEFRHSYQLGLLIPQSIFPEKENSESLKPQYSELWQSFYKEFTGLIDTDISFTAFSNSLLTLLKKYCWCIPSATNILPATASLYDHLKTTSAIAIALYDFCEDQSIQLSKDSQINESIFTKDPLVMICVDISGIQNFIYDISSSKAAASLKGRSFYIEIILHKVIQEILNHESIRGFNGQIIYNSGGKAYLIFPNIKKVINAIAEVQSKLDSELFSKTGGKLFIAISHTSFRYSSSYGNIISENGKEQIGFINTLETYDSKVKERYQSESEPDFSLSKLWRSVSDKAADLKRTRFKQIFIKNFDDLFSKGEEFSPKALKCAVSGERIDGSARYLDEEEQIPISDLAYQQIQIGKNLRNSTNIYFGEKGIQQLDIGLPFSFLNNKKFSSVISINSWPNFNERLEKASYEHIFYGGNYQPFDENHNRIKTFEELCKVEDGSKSKIGILRMDVDNLGQIFIKGMKRQSFSDYSTLSTLLTAFFSGYVNNIQMESALFKEHIQIIYSGGDDLFAVGRWDATIEFASKVREEFHEFTKRKGITISAGIVIVNSKFPINKAAIMAGAAEKQAKSFQPQADTKNGITQKNALSLFDEVISWANEWDTVVKYKNLFISNSNVTGKGILHKIQEFKILRDHNETDYDYLWRSAYYFTRQLNKTPSNSTAHDLIKQVRDRIMHDTEHGSVRFLDLISVSSRWAELKLKST